MLITESIQLINAVKQQNAEETKRLLLGFKEVSLKRLKQELTTDAERLVFWCNLYNALFQVYATRNKATLKNNWSNFFKTNQLYYFQTKFSFDFIEHHILRRSKWKLSLGYLNHLFVRKFERALRVKKLDFRIHFILNCGAQSCPIIQVLTIENLEEVLNGAMKAYLEQEVMVNEEKKQIVLNQLFLFYLGDFGGKRRLKKLLITQNIILPTHVNYGYKFTTFNKSLKLNNFR